MSERIRQEIAASPFTGEGHRKFWARLRIAGVRSSKARVLRRMREAPLLAPPPQAAHVMEKAHTGILSTDRPNPMWGHRRHRHSDDRRRGGHRVYRRESSTAECVVIHAVKRATRFEALDPVRQGLKQYFSGFATIKGRPS